MAVKGDVNGQLIKVTSESLFAFAVAGVASGFGHAGILVVPWLSVISAYKAGSTKRVVSCLSTPFSPMSYSGFL